MRVLIFAGNSLSNKSWAYNIARILKEDFEVIVHEYSHWNSGDEEIDFEIELGKISKEYSGEFFIFSKSIGVALSLMAISENFLKCKKIVCVGTPVSFCEKNRISLFENFKKIRCEKLFIQNDKDPACFSAELNNHLKTFGAHNFKMVELKGDNHKYDDVEMLVDLMKKFFAN